MADFMATKSCAKLMLTVLCAIEIFFSCVELDAAVDDDGDDEHDDELPAFSLSTSISTFAKRALNFSPITYQVDK